MPTASNIDEYIAQFPTEIKSRLKQMRTTIQKAAPKAEEAISYAIAHLQAQWEPGPFCRL
jgi:uncharacterized protein YdhG (YjbR/CyaY superfamily)